MASDNDEFVRPTSSHYLMALPPVACLAFAARCGRRLQSALAIAEHPASECVDKMLGMVEAFCSGEDVDLTILQELFDSLSYIEEKETCFDAAETAAVVARWASLPVLYPQHPAGPAHFAAENTYLSSPVTAKQAWRDYCKLRDAVQRGDIFDGATIEPSFFREVPLV